MWNAAQKQARSQNTWTGKSDIPLLESYCRNVVLARALRMQAREFTSMPLDGYASRLLKVAGDSEAAAHRYATALLLTPESRKRHGIQAPEGGAESELSALVA